MTTHKAGEKVIVPRSIEGEVVPCEGTVQMVIPRQDDSVAYRIVFDDGVEVIVGSESNLPKSGWLAYAKMFNKPDELKKQYMDGPFKELTYQEWLELRLSFASELVGQFTSWLENEDEDGTEWPLLLCNHFWGNEIEEEKDVKTIYLLKGDEDEHSNS